MRPTRPPARPIRIAATGKVAALEIQKTTAIQKGAQDSVIASQRESLAVKQLDESYQSFIATIKGLSGDTAGQQAIDTAQKVEKANELLIQKFGAGGNPAILATYKSLVDGTNALALAQKALGIVTDEQANKEAQLAIDAQTSGKGQIETLLDLGAARKTELEQLDQLRAAAVELADSLKTPEAIKFANDLTLAFKQAKDQVDPLAKAINDDLKSNFTDAFSGFLDGTKSAKDAFRDFANSVIADIAKVAAKDLATSIFGGSSSGGIGGFISGLIGGTTGASGAGDAAGTAANAAGATASATALSALAVAAAAATTALTSVAYTSILSGAGAGSGISEAATVGGDIVSAYGLATGTNFVPYDGFKATLHKGEAVVPKEYNPAAGGLSNRGGSAGGDIHVHMTYQEGQTKDTAQQQGVSIGQGIQRSLARNG